MTRAAALILTVSMGLIAAGCSGRPSMWRNPDPELRKSSAEFAADAAKRFPYPAGAAQAGRAVARAQVGYMLNRLEVVNLSDQPWTDVEVWVNRSYVVHVPSMNPNQLKRLPFQMIFDDSGQHFPLKNDQVLVDRVEIYQGGKIYEVPFQLAD